MFSSSQPHGLQPARLPQQLIYIYIFFATLLRVWDLSSPARGQTCAPCIERHSLNHWTTRNPFSCLTLHVVHHLPLWRKQPPKEADTTLRWDRRQWITEFNFPITPPEWELTFLSQVNMILVTDQQFSENLSLEPVKYTINRYFFSPTKSPLPFPLNYLSIQNSLKLHTNGKKCRSARMLMTVCPPHAAPPHASVWLCSMLAWLFFSTGRYRRTKGMIHLASGNTPRAP